MSNTILIVDECREYRESLVDYFNKRDFETFGASTYHEAQKLLMTNKIDVAVLDFTGPSTANGPDAFGVTAALAAEIETAVIIMSGQQTPELERRIRQIGPAFYFAKPFAVDNLYAVVLKVFDFRDKSILRKRNQRAAA